MIKRYSQWKKKNTIKHITHTICNMLYITAPFNSDFKRTSFPMTGSKTIKNGFDVSVPCGVFHSTKEPQIDT